MPLPAPVYSSICWSPVEFPNAAYGRRRRRIEAGVEPARTSRKERYAMSRDTTVIPFRQPEAIDDPLTEVAREGARRMLAQVLIAEAAAFVAQWKDLKLPDGRDRVVRHGHGPHRAIQTGVGACRGPSRQGARPGRRGRGGENPLYLVDPAEVGAADEESRCAVAGSLPAWGVDRRLPGGSRRALSIGRAEPVPGGDLAAD